MGYYVVKKINEKPCHRIEVDGETIFDCFVNDKWEIVSIEYNDFKPVKNLILHIRKMDEVEDE